MDGHGRQPLYSLREEIADLRERVDDRYVGPQQLDKDVDAEEEQIVVPDETGLKPCVTVCDCIKMTWTRMFIN